LLEFVGVAHDASSTIARLMGCRTAAPRRLEGVTPNGLEGLAWQGPSKHVAGPRSNHSWSPSPPPLLRFKPIGQGGCHDIGHHLPRYETRAHPPPERRCDGRRMIVTANAGIAAGLQRLSHRCISFAARRRTHSAPKKGRKLQDNQNSFTPWPSERICGQSWWP
jgi:hypothetical protein